MRLLKIRQDTFLQATPRTNADYVSLPNPEEEHPTQAYPNLPILRFPSNYRVSSQADADLCDKAFIEHNAFAAGIYSIGCGCDQNITLGFELMLRNEGPKNLFRILQCRDIDMDSLQGILVDHASGTKTFLAEHIRHQSCVVLFYLTITIKQIFSS